MTFRRFLRTPKGLLIVVLLALVAIAARGAGVVPVGIGIGAAVLAAVAVDAPMRRWRGRRWVFPDGAVLTALIIAMVLSPSEPWPVPAATAAFAVLSRYVVRVRTANVFNPAALGLVVVSFVVQPAESWWGALPDAAPAAIVLLLAAGLFIAQRVHKVPVVLAFLGAYYLLATVAAYVGNPAVVSELYRAPDLHAALYFACSMVTDPPTSPPRQREQLVYGGLVGLVAFAIFERLGVVYFLPAGLLVANAWEAWRRHRAAASRRGARAASYGALAL